jgi:hypothetical protein
MSRVLFGLLFGERPISRRHRDARMRHTINVELIQFNVHVFGKIGDSSEKFFRGLLERYARRGAQGDSELRAIHLACFPITLVQHIFLVPSEGRGFASSSKSLDFLIAGWELQVSGEEGFGVKAVMVARRGKRLTEMTHLYLRRKDEGYPLARSTSLR